MKQLLQELKEKIVEELQLEDVDPNELADDTPFFDGGLGLVSVDLLVLVVLVERDYGVEIFSKDLGEKVFITLSSLAEYIEANRFNHVPRRPRKLLLHRREIDRFASRAFEKGLTLVPLKLYFKRGVAKLLLGICRGRKQYDKREAMKEAAVKRDLQRLMRRRG